MSKNSPDFCQREADHTPAQCACEQTTESLVGGALTQDLKAQLIAWLVNG